MTIPDAASLHLTAAMTLEAWVNPATVDAVWRDVIYKGDDNYYLEGTSSTRRPAGGAIIGGSYGESYGTADAGGRTPGRISRVTYDGTTLRLYVNGTQVVELPPRPARSPPRPTRSRSAATRSTASTSPA